MGKEVKEKKIKLDKEDKKERKIARRNKRNARTSRFRFGKNIAIWLTGIISGILIFILTLALIPIGTVLDLTGVDKNTLVSENVSNKGLVQFIRTITENKLSDFPVITNAVDSDTGILGVLDDLMEYSAVNEKVDNTASGFNAKLYYYKTGNSYARAFNDDSTYVAGVNADTPLYYANLAEIPISDLGSVALPLFEKIKAVDLVSALGVTDVQLISDILGDMEIGEVMSFDYNTIKISAFFENTEDNKQLISILKSASGKDFEDMEVGDFTTFNTDNILLVDVLGGETDDNKTLVSVLESSSGKDYSQINVGDLNTVEFDNILLKDVLEVPSVGNEYKNQKLYDILLDAVDKYEGTNQERYVQLKAGDLNDFDPDSIKLISVLEDTPENKKIYDILTQATGVAKDELTILNLNGFNTDNVKLSAVLEYDGNETLYNILVDAVSKPDEEPKVAQDITMADLGGGNFSTDRIKLKTVIPSSSNSIINELLSDKPGKEPVTLGNIGESLDAIKLSDVYEVDCFISAEAGTGVYYKLSDADDYILKSVYDASPATYGNREDAEYNVSSSSGVWLFMLYTHSDVDTTTGHAKEYRENEFNFGGMEDGIDDIAESIENASVRQLVDSGIISDPVFDTAETAHLYAEKLSYVLGLVKNPTP